MQQNKAKQKKPFDWLLLIIYSGLFMSDLNYSSLSSFYPVEAKNQADLSDTLIGAFFAIYSIWYFITTFCIAKLMQKPGRKKMFCILGLFLEIVGLGVFLILKSVND
jgi:MFS family permease